MNKVPALVVAVMVAGAFCARAGSAMAVSCGTVDPLTNQPLEAALTLNPDRSDTTLPFRWSRDTDSLKFVFAISGCELPTNATADVELQPHGTPHIKMAALKKQPVTISNGKLSFDVLVNPTKFKPGKYDVVVDVTGTNVSEQVVVAHVSRSAHWLWALLAVIIGSGAALAYGLWKVAARIHRRVHVRPLWLAVATIVSLAVGGWVIWSDYFSTSIEAWTLTSDFPKTLLDAFLAASSGAVAGFLTRVWQVKRKAKTSAEVRAVIDA